MASIRSMLYGKMSGGLSAPTTEMTSSASSVNSVAYWEKNFLRLDLRSGQPQGRFWEHPVPSLGELSMHNIGVYPREEVVSTLSQILEDNVPEKYYLSPKACEGILRRAKSRGKELPERLRVALEEQMKQTKAAPEQDQK